MITVVACELRELAPVYSTRDRAASFTAESVLLW